MGKIGATGAEGQGERLAKARAARKFADAKSAAEYFGWNYTTYSQHERGERGLRPEVAARYAKAFRVAAGWLLTGEGPPVSGAIPVAGYAQAGDDVSSFGAGQGPLEYVKGPPDANDNTVAVEIRGVSLGPLLEGFLAFYDDRRDPPTADLAGKVCVCGLHGDGVVIKRMRLGSKPGHWHLESQTQPTMYDQIVLWAAPVTAILPK